MVLTQRQLDPGLAGGQGKRADALAERFLSQKYSSGVSAATGLTSGEFAARLCGADCCQLAWQGRDLR